jgi:hypothetical protein
MMMMLMLLLMILKPAVPTHNQDIVFPNPREIYQVGA